MKKSIILYVVTHYSEVDRLISQPIYSNLQNGCRAELESLSSDNQSGCFQAMDKKTKFCNAEKGPIIML